jgi:hypothetical protein
LGEGSAEIMKKLDKSISADLDALVIYEEELRDIFNLLIENCKGVKFTSGDLQFDNVDELIKNYSPNRIKELEISTVEPYISIELKKLWARIYAGSSAPAVEGLYHKCITILRRRSKAYGVLCSYRVFWTFTVVEYMFASIFKGPWSLCFGAIYTPYFFWTMFVHMTRHSLIYSRKADSFESFLIRNKDKLIVDTFVGFIGIVIGILIQRFILK